MELLWNVGRVACVEESETAARLTALFETSPNEFTLAWEPHKTQLVGGRSVGESVGGGWRSRFYLMLETSEGMKPLMRAWVSTHYCDATYSSGPGERFPSTRIVMEDLLAVPSPTNPDATILSDIARTAWRKYAWSQETLCGPVRQVHRQ
jgi:hypothetical protein